MSERDLRAEGIMFSRDRPLGVGPPLSYDLSTLHDRFNQRFAQIERRRAFEREFRTKPFAVWEGSERSNARSRATAYPSQSGQPSLSPAFFAIDFYLVDETGCLTKGV